MASKTHISDQLLLSDSTRNVNHLVLIDNVPAYFSETRREARESIIAIASEHEKKLREQHLECAKVTREVLNDGDELHVCEQMLGNVYNGNVTVSLSLRVMPVPWLSSGSPLFKRNDEEEEEEDEDSGSGLSPDV